MKERKKERTKEKYMVRTMLGELYDEYKAVSKKPGQTH